MNRPWRNIEHLRERGDAEGETLRHRHALYHTHVHRHAHARLMHVWQHHCYAPFTRLRLPPSS